MEERMIEAQITEEPRRAATLKRHRRRTPSAVERSVETPALALRPMEKPTTVEERTETPALPARPAQADTALAAEAPTPARLETGAPGLLDVLGNHRLAVGLSLAGVALLVAVLGLGVSLSSLLVIGMVLLCPLGHLLMMRGHGHDGSAEHGQQHAGGGACHGGPARQSARLDAPGRE
jgi:hypothetical protein